MTVHLREFFLGASRTLARQSSDPTGDDTSSGDLVSDVGNEIKVTLDRWSVGQLGVSDLIAAAAVVVGGVVGAWLVNRLVRRAARNTTGAARTAIGTIGQLVGALITLLAVALALEMLGFSLGPILVLILAVVVAVLLLRPLITNLSSGLLLQLRGALDVGDLVSTHDEVLGVVQEITTRTVVIDTADGRRVHVPNSDVLNNTIVNYTTLGCRRSTFEVTVNAGVDLDLVISTARLTLSQVDEIHSDPQSEVQVARVAGRLAVIRCLVWHEPGQRDQRSAIDAGIRAVIADLRTAGIGLDGPTLLELDSDRPTSGSAATA